MKLTKMSQITGQIELLTGLHIGSGNTEMHIGGTDNPVIKNPITKEPYIPGSSIKGKMRSLLEWHAGVVGDTNGKPVGFAHIAKLKSDHVRAKAETILKLFGGAPEGGKADTELVKKIGPTRLSFWDCELTREWVSEVDKKNILLTETKMENTIDRIGGAAENPRNTERVIAGSVFDFKLTLRVHDDESLIDEVLNGLRLLELGGLGGSGSRGYGKLKFSTLDLDRESILEKLKAVAV